jgi:hypothetical protein
MSEKKITLDDYVFWQGTLLGQAADESNAFAKGEP